MKKLINRVMSEGTNQRMLVRHLPEPRRSKVVSELPLLKGVSAPEVALTSKLRDLCKE